MRVLIQVVPAQVQSAVRTLTTSAFVFLRTATDWKSLLCPCLLCTLWCREEVFVSFLCLLHWEVVQRQKLIGAGDVVSMSTAAGCWSRRKRCVVVQHFLRFVSQSSLRWSLIGTTRVHHFLLKRLNDFWMAPWLILLNQNCRNSWLVCLLVLFVHIWKFFFGLIKKKQAGQQKQWFTNISRHLQTSNRHQHDIVFSATVSIWQFRKMLQFVFENWYCLLEAEGSNSIEFTAALFWKGEFGPSWK